MGCILIFVLDVCNYNESDSDVIGNAVLGNPEVVADRHVIRMLLSNRDRVALKQLIEDLGEFKMKLEGLAKEGHKQFRVFVSTEGGMDSVLLGVADLMRLTKLKSDRFYGSDLKVLAKFALEAEIGEEIATGNAFFIRVKDRF